MMARCSRRWQVADLRQHSRPCHRHHHKLTISSTSFVVVAILLTTMLIHEMTTAPAHQWSLFLPCLALSSSSTQRQFGSLTRATPRTRTDPATDDTRCTYHYFAIGSNMVPETMTSLRNLQPRSATAAVLAGYELAFDIPTGGAAAAWLEPSAASVRRMVEDDSATAKSTTTLSSTTLSSSTTLVHGVLYELSATDFATLGWSEGVPWVYRWEACQVVPYVGDAQCAGRTALGRARQAATTTGTSNGSDSVDVELIVEAFVLTASPLLGWTMRMPLKKNNNKNDTDRRDNSTFGPDIPPSPSYLKLLQDGAAQWKLDQEYQAQLAAVPVNRGVPGIAELVLQTARRLNPR